MVGLVLIGVLAIILSTTGGGNAAQMRISANTTNVNITMQMSVQNNQIVPPAIAQRFQDVIVTVSRAPSEIGSGVHAYSLDQNVATAWVEARSGDRNWVRIVGQGAGQTRIRVMSHGGQRTMYINVRVDVPAQDFVVRDPRFGVIHNQIAPNSIEFVESDFNFFATTNHNFDVATSINTIDFSFAPGTETHGTRIDGNRFIVYPGSTIGVVQVRATLRRNTAITRDFPVHIFPSTSFGDLGLRDMTGSQISNSGLVIAPLVLNNTLAAPNFIDYDLTIANIPISNTRNIAYGNLTYRYQLINHNENITYVLEETPDQFRVMGKTPGHTYVDVMVFPVLQVGANTIFFNRTQDSHLQRTRRIRVEVRNTFRDDQLRFTEDNDINNEFDDIYAFFAIGRNDRFNFNVTMTDDVMVNNTPSHPLNNRVTFDIINSPIPVPSTQIGTFFNITYSPTAAREPNATTTMISPHFTNGVPYNSYFSISFVSNPGFAGGDPSIISQFMAASSDLIPEQDRLMLEVRSIAMRADGETPLASKRIPLRVIRSVTEMHAENSAGDIITTLFPVRNGVSNPFDFYVATDLGDDAVANRFSWTLSQNARTPYGELFNITREPATVGGRLGFSIAVNPTIADDVRIGVEYYIDIRYISGYTIRLPILVQERLESYTYDVIGLSGNAQIFEPRNTTRLSGGVNLFLRIDGTYSLNINAMPTHASVFASMIPSSTSIIVCNTTFTFRPTEEGQFTINVSLGSVNPDVLIGIDRDFVINITVINPIMRADFSHNWERIYSVNTLSHFASPLVEGSFLDFTLDFEFAGGGNTSSTINITTSYTSPNIRLEQLGWNSFRVHGLWDTGEDIFDTISFEIEQTFHGYTRSFTFGSPRVFHLNVREVEMIQSIHLRNVGETLNMTLNAQGTQSMTVLTTPYPIEGVHNLDIGFAFLVGGTIFNPNGTLIQNIPGIVSVNNAGQITAIHSNVGVHQHDVRLVVFAFDSIRRDGGGNLVFNPIELVHVPVNVYIFNPHDGDGQFLIETREQFLTHFGFVAATGVPNSIRGRIQTIGVQNFLYYERAQRNQAADIVTGYFRLAADIDFSGILLEPISHFNGTLTGVRTAEIRGGAEEQESKWQLQNMSFRTRTGVNAWTQWSTAVGAGGTENVGLFGTIGTNGLVQGISFTNAHLHVNFNRMSLPATFHNRNINVGMLAGINNGIVSDISVHFENANYIATGFERLNIGAVVGLNNNIIREENRMRTTGLIRVGFAPNDQHFAVNRRVTNINAGGVAGRNSLNGTISGRNAGGILQDNIEVVSQVTLLIVDQENVVTDEMDKNVGGIVGRNDGIVREISAEAVIFSAARGNAGGLVGFNTGLLENSYTTSAIYARGALGGIAGRNTGIIQNTYFDMYINTTIGRNIQPLLRTHVPAAIREQNPGWDQFYAGLIVGRDANTTVVEANPTIVGGVVGRNSGNVFNSFASSIFTRDTTHVFTQHPTIHALEYRGDIYIHGAQNVIVGGVIGRQEGGNGHNQVEGVYSNLLINYNSSGVRGAPIIGGVIGEIRHDANATIIAAYSYNQYRINAHAQEFTGLANTQLAIAGVVGRNNNLLNVNDVQFILTYAVLETSQVEWIGLPTGAARIFPITGINLGSVLNVGTVLTGASTMRNINLATWTDSGHAAVDYFINFSNADIYDLTGLTSLEFESRVGFGFPMVRMSFEPTDYQFELPLFIATPTAIVLQLHSQAALSARFGAQLNNRGEFNYVVIADNNPVTGTQSAALFYSSGGTRSGPVDVANRYFLDDLFTQRVSPSIASRRMEITITDENVAWLGRDTSTGEPRFFIQLTGVLGSFEIHATSTRHEEGLAIVGKVRFDVVPAIATQTLTRDAISTLARQSLLTNDRNNFNHGLSVQRGTTISLRGAILPNPNGWEIISHKTYAFDGVFIMNYSNGAPILMNRVEEDGFNFHFIPRMQVGDMVYLLGSLEIVLNIDVYDGAIYLDFRQDQVTFDGSNAAIYSGVFITDITPTAFNVMNLTTLTEEQRIEIFTTLTRFNFFTEDNYHTLFTDGNITRIHITDQGRSFFLVFELFVEPVIALANGYFEYRFNINLSIEIDMRAYTDIPGGNLFETPGAMPIGLFGRIDVIEQNLDGRVRNLLRDSANVDIIPQVLETITIQHYTSTTRAGLPIYQMRVTDMENQNWNVFTDIDPVGSLLKVYAHPFFSNIESFSLESSRVEQVIGQRPTGQGNETEDIIREWEIQFTQMVFDPINEVFTNYGVVSGVSGGEIHQVSTYRVLADGTRVFTWDGVYYIQTRLVVIQDDYINDIPVTPLAPGEFFTISLNFESVNGAAINDSFRLGVVRRPGLMFTYDGQNTREAVQAIGTTHNLTATVVGDVEIGDITTTDIRQRWQDAISISANHPTASVDSNDISINVTSATATGAVISIEIGPTVPEGTNIMLEIIGILFEGGDRLQLPDPIFNLTAVLFRVLDFRVDGVMGNTIRLRNNNQQQMHLRAVVDRYTGPTLELQQRIDTAITALENQINTTELVTWTGWNNNRGWILNRSEWNQETEFYYSEVGPGGEDRNELNFFLGRGATSNIKFISASTPSARTTSLEVRMYYEIVGGRYSVRSGGTFNPISTTFSIVSIRQSPEDNPYQIWTESDLIAALEDSDSANGHFILMADITLGSTGVGWLPRPINFNLDGNNKRLTLSRIAQQTDAATVNIGLFTTIAQNQVIKNLNIVPGTLGARDHSILTVNLGEHRNNIIANIGVLAGINNGIVTNVAILPAAQFYNNDGTPHLRHGHQVASFGTTQNPHSTFDIDNDRARARLHIITNRTESHLRVGGLVGQNSSNGVISNSRVLVDIEATLPQLEHDLPGNFAARTAYIAGFVGENSGYIVSSFYRDGNVNNRIRPNQGGGAGIDRFSRTAGFVGLNRGIVRGNYVQGATNTIDQADGGVRRGAILSNYNVTGFVYVNIGTIQDAFVNITLGGSQERIGFVRHNSTLTGVTGTGTIINSFVHNAPRVGAEAGFFPFALNYTEGNMYNNKFIRHESFTASIPAADLNLPQDRIAHINITNIDQTSEFLGFSISEIIELDTPNMWQMTVVGPRLVSANHIAISIRRVSAYTWPDGEQRIEFVPGFEYGTSRYNPIIITNGDQFNRYMFEDSEAQYQHDRYLESNGEIPIDWSRNVYQGYLRLVNNISLRTATATGITSHGGLLRTQGIIFRGHFDGNGLEINDISMNAAPDVERGLQSVGLFSKVEHATIKNINLNFIKHPVAGIDYSIAAIDAEYVGGLAGIAINSNLVDINLGIQTTGNTDNQLTIIGGANVIGGLVGVAVMFNHDASDNNTFKIENIASNVRVSSLSNSLNSRDLGLNYDQLGIAGGIMGVITHDVREFVRGDRTNNEEMFMRDIFNYDRENSRDFRVLSRDQVRPLGTEVNPHIAVRNIRNFNERAIAVTGEIAGGLVGIIGSEINTTRLSYEFDGANNIADNFIRGAFYVGGLVGMNFGTIDIATFDIPTFNVQSIFSAGFIFNVDTSYTTIRHGMTVGGIAGFNAGTISHATNNTNMATNSTGTHEVDWRQVMTVGGIVGENVGGTIEHGRVYQSLASGFVLGGIAGISRGGTIENNFVHANARVVVGPPTPHPNLNFTINTGLAGSTHQIHESFQNQASFGTNELRDLSNNIINPNRNLRREYTGTHIGVRTGSVSEANNN